MPLPTEQRAMRTKYIDSISLTHHGAYSLILAVVWTAVVSISLVASIWGLRNEMSTIAQNIARAYIDKDILYRSWNALHGGIYVPVNHGLTPNPFYPPSMPERDLTTPSGRQLTLVNPSYMTRQIYEMAQKQDKISGRLTSLKPLRPENKASRWEAAALQEFERGKREVSGLETEQGTRYMKLMRPLVTEESCLACHASQGYKKGDIRGGISISFPMALLDSGMSKQYALLGLGHGIVWLLGLAGLSVGYGGLRRRTEERDRALEELRGLNDVLARLATIDPVTGICNRRRFAELLDLEIEESRRYGMPLAVIFFDVDHFKSINDNYGHEVGDLVLRELAEMVSGMIRKTDILARYGGEEFVVVAHDNDAVTARALAEKIRSRVSENRFPHSLKVTCSFGVAKFYPDDTAETVLRRADEAMYAAKHGGRNRVETRCDCQACT